MRKKMIGILICVMLLVTSAITTIIKTNNVKGEDTPPESIVSNSLNMTYIWKQTERLANVTYDAYNDADIPRGRSFGSKGGELVIDINFWKNVYNCLYIFFLVHS